MCVFSYRYYTYNLRSM